VIEQACIGKLEHPDNDYARMLARAGKSQLETWFLTLSAQFGHQAPNDESLRLCAKYGPLLSMGAGLAYVECLLSRMGVQVVPVDIKRGGFRSGCLPGLPVGSEFMIVLEGDETYVRDCPPGYNLLMWWPPPPIAAPPMASNCVKFFRGDYLLYAGMPSMRTGDLEFHWMLRHEWKVKEEVLLPGTVETDARLWVYERNPSAITLEGPARVHALRRFEASAEWQALVASLSAVLQGGTVQ
jgi:hypothetical protein